jgi:hypothetical protein
MRTKTLLLTAVLAALGSASSLAQVYSVNAVGYINLSLRQGYNVMANQLNGTNNKLGTLVPNAPDTTEAFKWDGAAQQFKSWVKITGVGWLGTDPEPDVNPGEAVILNLAAPLAVTLVGEVPQGQNLTVNLAAGYSLVSSIVPQSAALETIGLPTADQDTVFILNATGAYDSWVFLTGVGWLGSIPGSPTPKVGEGFWMQKTAAAVWTRNFSVNTP